MFFPLFPYAHAYSVIEPSVDVIYVVLHARYSVVVKPSFIFLYFIKFLVYNGERSREIMNVNEELFDFALLTAQKKNTSRVSFILLLLLLPLPFYIITGFQLVMTISFDNEPIYKLFAFCHGYNSGLNVPLVYKETVLTRI